MAGDNKAEIKKTKNKKYSRRDFVVGSGTVLAGGGLMSGPLAGTLIPFAGRTNVSGLSPQAWPINWFSKSNFGGSFATMLKLAGWDGIVVEGKADAPVFINIVDDKFTIENARSLWGLSTWEAHGYNGQA